MSTLTPADRLLQSIRVRASGATTEMITLELFNAIDEFLKHTMAWRETNDITLDGNNLEYDMGVPAGAAVVRIVQVTHNGLPVGVTGSGGVVSLGTGILVPELTFPDGDSQFMPTQTDLAGGVFTYAVYRPDIVTISTPADAEKQKFPLQVVIALTISEDSLALDAGDWQLPDWMYTSYFQDWLDGALFKLFSMPNKPWSSKDLMLYHGKRWRSALSFRKQEANRGFTYGVPGWRFRRW